MEYYEFRAMNTEILLTAEGDADNLATGFRDTAAFIQAREAQLTRFSESSELSRLNHSAGNWCTVSSDLYDLIHASLGFYIETDGLFDPAILDALERVGYDASMDTVRARGANPFDPARPRHANMSDIQFDREKRRVRLPAGMRLDLGGIAKGWIAERAARVLKSYSDACAVDAGGDMFMISLPSGEETWQVALEDPRDGESVMAVLRQGPGAIATSSVMRRRWKQGTQERHHLIDPRTELPAETGWLSVTVIAPHADVAEVFAKSLLIAGPERASEIACVRPDLCYIAVDRSGNMWGSARSKELLQLEYETR